MKEILDNWNIGNIIEVKSLNEKVTLIRTEEAMYTLKLKKDITHSSNIRSITTEHQLTSKLIDEGLNVPRPVKTIQGSDVLEICGELYCLYNYIEGTHVHNHYDDAVDLNHLAFIYGESISKLHKGLLAITETVEAKQTHFFNDVNAWAIPMLNEYNYIDDDIKEIINYMAQYELIYEMLPTQLIHRDLHPSHFLIQNDQITGFIDFEISLKGIRLFDICYCCTALLGEAVVDMFKGDETKLEQWMSYVSHLVRGYNEHTELTDDELACIPLTMMLIQFIMSAYFSSVDENDLTHQNLDVLKWVFNHRNELLKRIHNELE